MKEAKDFMARKAQIDAKKIQAEQQQKQIARQEFQDRLLNEYESNKGRGCFAMVLAFLGIVLRDK